MKQLSNSDCDIRNQFPTAKKLVENEGIQGHSNLDYRAAAWIGYYRLLPDIIGYFPYSFIIHELPGGKNVWK